MPEIKMKSTVGIAGKHFEGHIAKIIQVAADTAPPLSDNTLWITSANDSKHKDGSRHYTSEAFDIRTRNIVGNIALTAREWAGRMQRQLGVDYDVIFEGDHIHAEYDPK